MQNLPEGASLRMTREAAFVNRALTRRKAYVVDSYLLLKYVYAPFLLAVIVCNSGCGIAGKMARQTRRIGGHFSMQVAVADNANQNQPIAVDLVLVKDKKLLAKFSELPSTAWFDKRDQIMRDNAKKVDLVSWEWVPGQVVSEVDVKIDPSITGAVIFARYSTPGDHRAILSSFGPSQLSLDKEDFSYQPRKG